MHDDPLVMPAHQLLRLPEQLRPRETVALADVLDDPVVEADEQQVQLREDQVLVVARVAGERAALCVARQVVEHVQELHAAVARVGPLIQERLVRGARAVDRVEVQARRAEVDQRERVVELLQLRARVERDVVIDELAEVRVARWDVRVVRAGMAHRLDERFDRSRAELARGQLREHPAEAPAVRRRHVRGLGAARDTRSVATGALRRHLGSVSSTIWDQVNVANDVTPG